LEPSIILGQFFFGFVFALALAQVNIEHHANSNPEFTLTVQVFQLFLWIVVVGILFSIQNFQASRKKENSRITFPFGHSLHCGFIFGTIGDCITVK
jgi:glucan phosphoethanolaminetransferase (alkaline phosphatase superfamily)